MSSPSRAGGQKPPGPPYPPTTAALGLTPNNSVDTPICAVLLVLFIAAAATNIAIFHINRRRDHKFIVSAMTFGFCVARIAALVMRIVWANRLTNVNIAIAASIFTLAGVIVLFLINLIFSQRIVRAYRPRIGWNKVVTILFHISFFSILGCLVMMIIVTVYSFFTLSPKVHDQAHKVQVVGSTYFAVLAFLPLPIVFATRLLPPLPPHHGQVEPFGKKGRLRSKVALLVFTATLLSLGAAFRAGTGYFVRPRNNPAWFHSKACYYCFNYVIELIVVYTYTILRFDLRFHVPNGASAPGHYSAGSSESVASTLAAGEGDNRPDAGIYGHENQAQHKPSMLDRINTEHDAFAYDEQPYREKNKVAGNNEKATNWDRRAQNELQREEEGQAA